MDFANDQRTSCGKKDEDEDEESTDVEDDYLSMVITEPTRPLKETSIQRVARKKREAQTRSTQKSKKDREEDAAAARELGLATSLDASNKGFKMMTKFGYQPGTTLGKSESARTEPIKVTIKADRGGIGHDSERKRKIQEEFHEAAKRVQVDQGDYRERMRQEREEKRMRAQTYSAQKVLEQLDTEASEKLGISNDEDSTASKSTRTSPISKRPLKTINVLWRGRLRERLEKEAEYRMRTDLQQSSSRLPAYNDSDEDEDDKNAYDAKRQTNDVFVEEDLYGDDAELEEFEALGTAERLDKLVMFLRDTYHYCFWCKHRYEDAEMDSCPGLLEDDHD